MGSVWGVVGSSQTQGQGWSPEDTLTQHIFFTKGKFLPYFWAERRGAGSPPVFAISLLPSAQGNKVTCFGVTCPDRLPPEIRSVFLGKTSSLMNKGPQRHSLSGSVFGGSRWRTCSLGVLAPCHPASHVFWVQQQDGPSGRLLPIMSGPGAVTAALPPHTGGGAPFRLHPLSPKP